MTEYRSGLPIASFADQIALEDWLAEQPSDSNGAWVRFPKKSSSTVSVTKAQAIDSALCFGWIDSKPGKLDEERSMLWFTPRKGRTGWSKLNKERVDNLINAGLMAPAGLAKVEAAKKDGSWNALDAAEALEIPPDLAKVFSKNKTARGYFEEFPRSVKKAILEWISSAKRPETRAKRIEETVTKAEQNIRANQWRQ